MDDPGVVVVWSREEPRLAIHRVPPDGLELGRDLIPWDDRLSRRHAVVTRANDGLAIRDLGSRTGISAPGEQRADGAWVVTRLPDIAMLARTVVLLVGDVRPYELAAAGRLVGSAVAAAAVHQLEEAARAEDHVVLASDGYLENLADRYVELVGAGHRFRSGGDQHLDHVLATRGPARVIVLDLSRPLIDVDRLAVVRLLETDVRFVVLATDPDYVASVPGELIAAARRIEVCPIPYDTLPAEIRDRVTEVVPGATVHASAIYHLITQLEYLDRDTWSALLDTMLDWWSTQGVRELRSEHCRYDFHWIGRGLPGTMLARPGPRR